MTVRKHFPYELAEEIASGRQVDLFFDNDGTTCPFQDDPSKVRMETGCFATLLRLTQYPNVRAVSITGRDVREAERMLTAYDGTLYNKGKVIWAKNRKSLPFGIIGSHGVEYMTPDGVIERHNLGQKADQYIANIKTGVILLKSKYPQLHIETGKHGCVALNTTLIENAAEQKTSYEEALAFFKSFIGQRDCPLHPETGEALFQLRCEGAKEMELRPVGFGKDFGIQRFGKTDPERMTVFFCDSLGDHGTDRLAAKLINTKFNKGRVVMVRNGRDECPKDPDCAPAHICKNPYDLGLMLSAVLQRISLVRHQPELFIPPVFQPR